MADFYAIQREPLDLTALAARVAGPPFGALATFSGTVRDTFQGRGVLYLEYEAYEPMALRVLGEIGVDLHARFAVGGIAIAHRTGRLEVGETSVAIAVSAPHRRAALEACAEAIERVKRSLPVWKKEFFEGGEVWRENERRVGVSSSVFPDAAGGETLPRDAAGGEALPRDPAGGEALPQNAAT
jgi:molybdopterin synthase catalytic subunit